jgi:hypothetical protein
MAGLFFCLASAEVQGFYFCPDAIQPHASIYSGFSAVHANLYHPNAKTVCMALQRHFR